MVQLQKYNALKTFQDKKIYNELLKSIDNYSLSIMYLKFINLINLDGYTHNNFISKFTEILLKNIDPNPELRLSVYDTMQKFNNILNKETKV